MFRQRACSRVVLALCAVAAAACSSDQTTGPDGDALDAPRLKADVAATEQAMNPDVLASFAALSARFDLGVAATAAVTASREVVDTRGDVDLLRSKQLPVAIAERLLTASKSDVQLSSPVLRPGSLGTTYVYDPALRRYVAAPGRTGAPANGVRFILYAVNPITHEPVASVEVGYADLIDEGIARPSGIGLRLIVVSESTTYLDYRVDLEGTDNAGRLAVSGFLTDGATRLQFNIEARAVSVPAGSAMNVAFEIAVPSRAFHVTGTVEGVQSSSGGLGRINLVARSGETKIAFSMTGDDHTVNATILVNDRVFATITGDHHSPIIRGAGGRELTPDEREALQGIMRLVGGVLELFGNLLKPVEAILALSSIP